MIITDAPSATVVAKLQHSSQFTSPDESTSWYLVKDECCEVMCHAQQLLQLITLQMKKTMLSFMFKQRRGCFLAATS